MPRNRFFDPEEQAIRNVKKDGGRALEILKLHREFPRIQVEIIEGSEKILESIKQELPGLALPSDDRLQYAIQLLDLRAANYVQLVSDLKTQEAFTKLLLALRRTACEEYRGFSEIEPIVGNKKLEQIDARVSHWRKESYKRCIPKPTEAAKPATVPNATPPKPKRKPTRIPSTVNSLEAAARMEAFISASDLTQTQFAINAGTTDRTLRSFRATGKIRGEIFKRIAREMGLTPAQLNGPASGK